MRNRFVSISDTHFSVRKPKKRVDDFYTVQLDKFEEVLFYCEENKLPLVVGGDFFDRATEPYFLCVELIHIMTSYDVRVYVVPGQHDIRFHKKGLSNTPLGILISYGLVKLLNDVPTLIGDYQFYGKGWGDDDITPSQNDKNVLVTHQMVIEDNELFPGQTNHQYANVLLKKNPKFRAIISGDNHRPHVVKKGEQININCGSMMRTRKDQDNHTPMFYDLDLDTLTVRKIKFTTEPFEKVFDTFAIEEEERKKESVDFSKFMRGLSDNKNSGVNFETTLQILLQKSEATESVCNIVNDVMECVKDDNPTPIKRKLKKQRV